MCDRRGGVSGMGREGRDHYAFRFVLKHTHTHRVETGKANNNMSK